MSDNFYRAFEDRYRGSRDIIKQRLSAYQPFFAPLTTLYPDAVALDLGCGRGEWLELLAEHGFDAHGVDLDEGMLAACRERGLQAELTDALSALRARADASLALVSAFHLVEHIPFDQVQLLIAEALRALRPGGLLILETPNPENLVVGASSFYLDPSHLRPVPSPLLDFVVGYAGFARHKVLRLQEAPDLHSDRPIGVIDVLDGVSPDYAVVGQKQATPAQWAPFDEPFAADYGLALSQLGQRYEAQQEERRAELHRALQGLITRIERDAVAGQESLDSLHKGVARVAEGVEHNRARLDAAEAGQLAQAQQALETAQAIQERQAQFEASVAAHQADMAQNLHALSDRLKAADDEAARARAHVADLLASSSWRVTAPLRMVASTLYRLRSAAREGRLGSGLRRRIKAPLLPLMRYVLRRPRLKRAALGLVRRFPALHARLYGVLRQAQAQAQAAPHPAPAPPPASSADALSPRARGMYDELKQAIEARKH